MLSSILSSIKSFWHNFKTYPIRGILTIITITIGVTTLIITTSLNMDIQEQIRSVSEEEGTLVVFGAGTMNDAGNFEFQDKSPLQADAAQRLEQGYENISEVTMISTAWTGRIIFANGKSYSYRNAIQTGEDYGDLMNLQMIEGSFFTADDVESRSKVVVISHQTAQLLFNTAENAYGQSIAVRSKNGSENYSVIGVFEDVSELERESYGIGDLIFPIGHGIPAGEKIHPVQFGAVFMARVTNDKLTKAESTIRTIFEEEYGGDLEFSLWEGSPTGPNPLLEENRNSLGRFAISVNILGIIILAISSIGIFSIMIVEILGRTREIGLRRSLGISRQGVQLFFIGQALWYTVFGGFLALLISFGIYQHVGTFLIPLFSTSGIRISALNLTMPKIQAILIAVGSSMVFGALFGFFPALSASRTPIIECLREDQN